MAIQTTRQRATALDIKLIMPQEPGALDTLPETVRNERIEKALIGAVLQDPDVYTNVADMVAPGDFYYIELGVWWKAVSMLGDVQQPIDITTLVDTVQRDTRLARTVPIDDATFMRLADMMTEAQAQNAEYYARRIREMAARRRIMLVADDMRKLALQEQNMDALIDQVNRKLFEATEQTTGVVNTSVQAAYQELSDDVDTRMEGGAIPAIPFHQKWLDEHMGANPIGEITVIGGTDGMGKTTWTLSMLYNLLMNGVWIAHFSLEMTRREVTAVLTSMASGIPKEAILQKQLTQEQYAKYIGASKTIGAWSLEVIDEFPHLTPLQLQRRLRKLIVAERKKIEVVSVDGLWLMEADPIYRGESSGKRKQADEERRREVHYITRDLIEIAKEFGVHIFITHQYNNEFMQRKNKQPKTTDLSESAAVRRNAQNIIGLFRDGEITEAHVLKMRNRNARGIGKVIDYAFDYEHNYLSATGMGVREND